MTDRSRDRRPLLVAKVGAATIVYTVLASPIACNLPNPPPSREDTDARAPATTGTTTSSASPHD